MSSAKWRQFHLGLNVLANGDQDLWHQMASLGNESSYKCGHDFTCSDVQWIIWDFINHFMTKYWLRHIYTCMLISSLVMEKNDIRELQSFVSRFELLVIMINHYNDVTWATWSFESPATQVYVQQLIQTDNKGYIKVQNYWPFMRVWWHHAMETLSTSVPLMRLVNTPPPPPPPPTHTHTHTHKRQ